MKKQTQNKNRNKKLIILLIIICLLLIITIFQIIKIDNINIENKNNIQKIRIGVITSQTGLGAYLSEMALKGIQLKIQELNNTNKLEIIYEDSKTNPRDAINAINKLILLDKVDYIIGDTWGTNTFSIIPIANEHKKILISPAMSVNDVTAKDYFYRTMPKTQNMIEKLVEYMKQHNNDKSIGIIIVNNPYAKDHLNSFKQLIAENNIIITEETTLGEQDYKSTLLKFSQKGVKNIFIVHASQTTANIMNQAKELNLDFNWFGHYSIEDYNFLKITDEKIIYPYPCMTQQSEFAENFEKKYNIKPDMVAVNSYEAISILIEANQNTPKTTDEIRKYIENRTFKFDTGNIHIDEYGDVTKDICIKQNINNEFVYI